MPRKSGVDSYGKPHMPHGWTRSRVIRDREARVQIPGPRPAPPGDGVPAMPQGPPPVRRWDPTCPRRWVLTLLAALPEGEPVALAVSEHGPPAERLFDRRLRKLDALGGQLAMGGDDVVALEHDVRRGQVLRGSRRALSPGSQFEHEGDGAIRGSHLQPALRPIRRVGDDLVAKFGRPELLRPILVLDAENNLLNADHGPLLLATASYIHSEYINRGVILSRMPTVDARAELTRSAFEVLVALQAGAAHGYAVMRFVDRITDGAEAIPAGTLDRTLARLAGEGVVEEPGPAEADAPHDARRRYYRLTDRGRQIASEEATLLARLLSAAPDAGVLPGGNAR